MSYDLNIMNRIFYEGKKFENLNFRKNAPEVGDYEECTFKNCDFSDSDLSEINFLGCEFLECNLSLARLARTSFREVKFIDSKLLGLHFEDCNNLMISFEFDGCTLDLSSYSGLKLKKTIFSNSKIIEADFTGTDLSNSSFINCDLQRAIFNNTNLEGADFRTSFNYSIDPDMNRIKKAKFSLSGLAGLLDKYDIVIDL
jgi:fluoroquinolone resistance protein